MTWKDYCIMSIASASREEVDFSCRQKIGSWEAKKGQDKDMADQRVEESNNRQMSPGQNDEMGNRDLSSHRAEEVNHVLYSIANAVNITPDLDKLYQVIHQTLSSIVDTTKFFIPGRRQL